ncbi:MAG: electron transport complex subunit RsxC [Clostridia bacterium]|nr:electron transport complex subunit RsxC [Clostridia bacterium]
MFGLATFKGGIHPDDMKAATCKKPIVDLPASREMVYPLQQSLGVPAVPCVQVGDRVLMGQKIAEAGGFVSAHIHSAVSGIVTAIEPRMTVSGIKMNSIIIENDGLDELCDIIKPKDWRDMSPKEIVEVVREAGVVGLGGATFPTHIKLSPPEGKKVEYVIINGAECEPYLTSDHRAMLETPEEIIEGLKIMLKVFGLKTGYIGIEVNKPDAIEKMAEYAEKEKDVEIRVVALKTKYPQGSEKHLIKAVTGREVPSGKLPVDVGTVVDNIDTCAAIARVFMYGTPLLKRIVTVSGDCVQNPSNFRVRIGTNVQDVIEKCGGFIKPAAKVIIGGPMMGVAISDVDIPIIKGSAGILGFSADAVAKKKVQNCLRCGRCAEGCPMNLLPNALKDAVLLEDMEKLNKLGVMDCIQCGSCTYVCPAEQTPLQYIRTGKAKLIKARQEAKK